MVMLRNFCTFRLPPHRFAYRNHAPKASGRAMDKPPVVTEWRFPRIQIQFQKQQLGMTT
jgi:hypothetical protein